MKNVNVVKTLDYGTLPVAFSNEFLRDDIIDVIDLSTPNEWAEIKLTLNGQLVALVHKNED